jgi:hypothetical protein
MIRNETEEFEAFDLVASALEELKLHEASVKPQAAEKKDSREATPGEDKSFAAKSDQRALDDARRYLQAALNETPPAANEKPTSKTERQPKGDQEYFKAHYLVAMTEYLSDNPGTAADFFGIILNPATKKPKALNESAYRAAMEASKITDPAFVEEVSYNLGASFFEKKEFGQAITQFDSVIESTKEKDLLLELLARSAKALAHANRHSETPGTNDSYNAEVEMSEVEKLLTADARFFSRIGWRNGLILRKRKIDQRTAQSIRGILKEVRHELARKKYRPVPAEST